MNIPMMTQRRAVEDDWIFAFCCFLLHNSNVEMDKLNWANDGIYWVARMFDTWNKNQNVHDVPKLNLKFDYLHEMKTFENIISLIGSDLPQDQKDDLADYMERHANLNSNLLLSDPMHKSTLRESITVLINLCRSNPNLRIRKASGKLITHEVAAGISLEYVQQLRTLEPTEILEIPKTSVSEYLFHVVDNKCTVYTDMLITAIYVMAENTDAPKMVSIVRYRVANK